MKTISFLLLCLMGIKTGQAQTSIPWQEAVPVLAYEKAVYSFKGHTVFLNGEQATTFPASVFPGDYLQKSKNQKRTAFLLLGSGAGLIVVAAILPRGEQLEEGICIGGYCSDKYKNDGIKSAFLITGASSALVSIPFFIASSKNKRKRVPTAVSLKMEDVMIIARRKTFVRNFPAASAIFPLGK